MPAFRLTVVLLAIAVLGCSGGGEEGIDTSDLSKVVLQPADLRRVWVPFDVGPQIGADAPGGERADPERFGRVEGWKARYRRPGSPATVGPLVIESRADLFDSADGARRDLEVLEEDLAETLPGSRPLAAPMLGDDAVAATVLEGKVRFYLVAWRQTNVTASLFLNGFDGRTTLAQTLALVRKQERRIAAATAS
jgi:hypothetical protein